MGTIISALSYIECIVYYSFFAQILLDIFFSFRFVSIYCNAIYTYTQYLQIKHIFNTM